MENIEGLIAETRGALVAVSKNPQDAASVLISVGVKLAARVNALRELTGIQKRELVVKVLGRALERLREEELELVSKADSARKSIEDRYAQLLLIATSAVPSAIDAAIDASRGKLNLKKIKARQLLQYCSCIATTAVSSLSAAGVISTADADKTFSVVNKMYAAGDKIAEKVDVVREAATAAEDTEKKESCKCEGACSCPAPCPCPAAPETVVVVVDAPAPAPASASEAAQ
jgi:outer membrane murein-binding lipoprotein Lpp